MPNSEPLYAAVRYIKDERKKIHILPIHKIKYFDSSKDYTAQPFWINSAADQEEESWEAGQVLKIDDDPDKLKNNEGRYKFTKVRLSDALIALNNDAIKRGQDPEGCADHEDEAVTAEDTQSVSKPRLRLNKKNKSKAAWNDKAKNRDHSEEVDMVNAKKKKLLTQSLKLPVIPVQSESSLEELRKENERLLRELEKRKLQENKISLSLEQSNEPYGQIQHFSKVEPTYKPRTSARRDLSSEFDEMLNEPGTSTGSNHANDHETPAKQESFTRKETSPVLSCSKIHRKAKKRQRAEMTASANDLKNESNLKTVKKHLNEKRKKKQKKLVDYDSDDFGTIQTNKKKYEIWTHTEEESSKQEKMIHLRYGVSLRYKVWSKIRQQPSPSLFCRRLAHALWGTYNLINRAIDLEKTKEKIIEGRDSPRKQLTPVKSTVVKKCYIDYLKLHNSIPKKMDKKEKKKLLNKWCTYLSKYINYLRCTSQSSNEDDQDEDKERQEESNDSQNNTDSDIC